MIAIAVIASIATLAYEIKYRLYKRRIVNYILRVKCFINTYNEICEVLIDENCVGAEVNSHFCKFQVDKSDLKKYYSDLIKELTKLEKIYFSLSNSILFEMDDELTYDVIRLHNRLQNIEHQIRLDKWRGGY